MNKIKKITISIIILFFIISIGNIANAKYIIEYTNSIGNINVDRQKPKIELTNIVKSNDKNYITFRIKIIEKNIVTNRLNDENLLIKVENKNTSPKQVLIRKISEKEDAIIYDIQLEGIKTKGEITLIIKDSIIIDIANQGNEEKIIKTKN